MAQEKKRNVIVGQSGGPTAAINSSLAGVYHAAKNLGYQHVYGILKRTPSAYLGSCRYKLPEINDDKDLYEKLFAILDELEIDVFIYIGGNDSMDTIKKLADYGIITGSKIRFVGSPKTIDNDLAYTDGARRGVADRFCRACQGRRLRRRGRDLSAGAAV